MAAAAMTIAAVLIGSIVLGTRANVERRKKQIKKRARFLGCDLNLDGQLFGPW